RALADLGRLEAYNETSLISHIRHTTDAGTAVLKLNAAPSDGTSTARVRVGNGVVTSGAHSLDVYDNAAVAARFSAKATENSFICGNGGNLGIGTVSPAYKLDVAGKFRFNPGIGTDATTLVDGDIAFEFTDATHLKIRARAGGTTRSVILTLT
ncbi:MAG: hypothetical protein AAAC47_11270, partial [Pararhizobium sp.]